MFINLSQDKEYVTITANYSFTDELDVVKLLKEGKVFLDLVENGPPDDNIVILKVIERPSKQGATSGNRTSQKTS